jgi:hypothetical protein
MHITCKSDIRTQIQNSDTQYLGDITTKRQVMPLLYLSISSDELVSDSQQAM